MMKMKKLHIGILAIVLSVLLMGCTTNAQASFAEDTVCGVGADCEETIALSPTAREEESTDVVDISFEVDASIDLVQIPTSEISSEVAEYTYLSKDGTEVRYFAVFGSDGEVHTAFDACDVCGGSQGYQQEGTDIFCRKCGRYFSIDGLGTQNKGYGCWPSYLPHTVEGDSIIIKKSDLESGAYRFA